MIQMENITKTYARNGGGTVEALKSVNKSLSPKKSMFSGLMSR